MIVFALVCQPGGHHFEGWFASSGDFVSQQDRGLVTCPQCGSVAVSKAPMAPAISRKGNQQAPSDQARPMVGGNLSAEAQAFFSGLAALQAEALKDSRWVGKNFAEQSRAIHYGEQAAEVIHGQATVEEAKEMVQEGIAVMPLLIPVAPPEELN